MVCRNSPSFNSIVIYLFLDGTLWHIFMELRLGSERSSDEMEAKLTNLKPALDRIASQTPKSAKVRSIMVLVNHDLSNQSEHASMQGIPSLPHFLPRSLFSHPTFRGGTACTTWDWSHGSYNGERQEASWSNTRDGIGCHQERMNISQKK